MVEELQQGRLPAFVKGCHVHLAPRIPWAPLRLPGTACDNKQFRLQMKNFERVTVDPTQMGGVPCVRHLRIPVATLLRLLAGGLS